VRKNGYRAQTLYLCEYCEQHGIDEAYEDEEKVKRHLKECIFNPENKTYATSKWLGVEMFPPFPRFEKRDRSYQVAALLNGYHHQPYDTRTGEPIFEEDFHKECPDWEEAEKIWTGRENVYKPAEHKYSKALVESKYYKTLKEAVDEAAEKGEVELKDGGVN